MLWSSGVSQEIFVTCTNAIVYVIPIPPERGRFCLRQFGGRDSEDAGGFLARKEPLPTVGTPLPQGRA